MTGFIKKSAFSLAVALALYSAVEGILFVARGHREEVIPIVPSNPIDIDQSHIGLMDQAGGVQGVANSLTTQSSVGQLLQLLVEDMHDAVEGLPVPSPPTQ